MSGGPHVAAGALGVDDRASAPRCLGAVSGAAGGPTVVITGGLHGNEPAGMHAAREVLAELLPRRSVLRGKVVAFGGNLGALERGVRFVSRDLNRGWHTPDLERLRAAPEHALSTEDQEQRDLHRAFLALERERSRLVFLDLHTTSGPTAPFVCFSDTVANRALACALSVNVVLGLEKSVDASMLSWASARGHLGVSFEAGQHDDPGAVRRHVGAVWLFLVAVGALDAVHVPDEPAHLAALAPGAGKRALVVEVRHRHVVGLDDEFDMLPGFKGFDAIEAGQIVARDRRGPVRAPEAGLLLMPRYQGQGEDGFFVVREVACAPRGVVV
ncbi:MAG: succinylglutamate desuccinylase/aspartoacylase family protein [Labilithrix sp.]|nr:succinylglutamate desuccinylase/aspartoacylase family protein [Labilithrix sp.]MBX3223348.1 succinylglutamate desuccinylase/aspartoacylase family protein [Labilithrix sp.]